MINPLIHKDVINLSPSMKGGIAPVLELHLRILATEILQKAGRALNLPQPTISTSQVLIQRFYFEGSMIAFSLKDIILGSMFLACKLSETPRRTRDIINAIQYMILSHKKHENPGYLDSFSNEYSELEKNMYRAEMYILKCLGFHIHVVHPYMWALNYLKALGFTDHPIVQSTWNYINDSYRTVVHCMYQPNVIATACIFLASCNHQIILPVPWYRLFDVDAKDMFQVVDQIKALYSIRLRWDLPLSTAELGEWITPHLDAKLSLQGYEESLELLKAKKAMASTPLLLPPTPSEQPPSNGGPPSAKHPNEPAMNPPMFCERATSRSRSRSRHSASSTHSKRASSYTDRNAYPSTLESSLSSSSKHPRRHSRSRERRASREHGRSRASEYDDRSHYPSDRRRDSSRSRRRSSYDRYSSRREDRYHRSSRH